MEMSRSKAELFLLDTSLCSGVQSEKHSLKSHLKYLAKVVCWAGI